MANETQFELRLRTILEAYSLPGRRISMGAQTPLVLLKDDAGKVLLAANNLVPPDGVAGYAKGCILLKTDALTSVSGFYINIGTVTACKFSLIQSGQLVLPFAAVPASGVACHAAVQEGAANAFPGPFTNPTIPRSLECVFAAGWQGGDVTVIGLNQFGVAVTETFVAVAGATVPGVKIFASIASASKATQAGTTDTVQLQTSTKIGISVPLTDANVVLFANDPADFAPPADCPEAVTVDLVYNAFTPESVPDGAISFKLICNT